MRVLQHNLSMVPGGSGGAGGTRSSVVQSNLKFSTQPRVSFVRKASHKEAKHKGPQQGNFFLHKGCATTYPWASEHTAMEMGAFILMQKGTAVILSVGA